MLELCSLKLRNKEKENLCEFVNDVKSWAEINFILGIPSKNYAKGFSDVQIKVREATSNDTYGPSGSLMNEIAQMTFNE